MAVYVDRIKKYKSGYWCHMISTDISELHKMAQIIGLQRVWFQEGSTPHYDLRPSKRRLAIARGAIEMLDNEFVEVIKKIRGDHE